MMRALLEGAAYALIMVVAGAVVGSVGKRAAEREAAAASSPRVEISTTPAAAGAPPFDEPFACYEIRPIGAAARARGGRRVVCCGPGAEGCP